MSNDVTSAPAGTDPPDEDGAPSLPWLRRAALRVRDAAAGSWAITLLLLADLVTVLGAGAVWLALGGDAAVVGVTAAALLAFATAMLPLIARRGPDGQPPLWPPFVLVVIPLAVLAVGLPSWGIWAVLESRPVDVTNRVRLDVAPPLVNGDTVHASLHTDDPKPRLALTFDVAPHDPAAPVCVPGTELTVTSTAGAGKEQVRTGVPGTEFTFALGRGMTDVELSVLIDAEQGCEVDLSVASAYLDD
ncbi:hypothetical protein [Streptomyces sp. NRRL S-37]|uniref:hypothetical protein n=1 Tax=Streptomyces sp. NRRL S-37 TaxID=1463903 RepID=UPI0004CBAD1E|nr:hypothetical protein [Streptomyces sp. NRRL S-37]